MSQLSLPNASAHPVKQAYYQQGFTLIELMISLVLGLLICAAVVQIYITNVRTSTVQKSGSELQDASVFGIQQLESHIRLANLGNPTIQITDSTVQGGIVLSAANVGIIAPATYTTPAYLSHSAGDTAGAGVNGWTGISNMNVGSDQLTLQFTNTTGNTMPDCEGNDINPGEMAIERYFLRPSSTNTSTTAVKNLVLACDAGRMSLTTSGQPTGVQTYSSASDQRNFGQTGIEFIPNVDQFNVLLGTETTSAAGAGLFSYMPINSYMTLSGTKPAITSVKIALVVHGSTPIVGMTDSGSGPYSILGTSQTLNNDSTRQQQVHTTYESSILLRNARVTTLTTS